MEKQSHILIVEDDAEIARLVAPFLERAGFRTTHLPNGKQVANLLEADQPDLVLLDLLLPGEDGLSIARRIRGLDLGVDDYITKPFSAQELVARVRAVLRRSEPRTNGRQGTPVHYSFAGWDLDARRRDLFDPDAVRVEPTSAEFEMLRTFCDHPGTVLGRDQLAKLAQGRRVEPYDRSVDTLISRLRSKIEPEETSPSLIKTVRHSGYVFTPTVVVTLE